MFCRHDDANIVARFLKEERHTRCVNTEFHGESSGVFGFSIYRAHNSVFTISTTIIFVP